MSDYSGEEYLRKVFSNLHMSPEVERTAKKSDTPREKIRRYMERLESITSRSLDATRETQAHDHSALRRLYYRKYLIKKENVPESYFELKQRVALENGWGHVDYDDETRDIEIQQIISDQKYSLDVWLDYLESDDAKMYPTWFKYYAFQGMVKLGAFDKGKNTFSRRTTSTVKPFIELNMEALALVYDELTSYLEGEYVDEEQLRNLLDGGNFGKIYAHAIKKLDGVKQERSTDDEGIWRKYEQGSDAQILFDDLAGKGTGWCTAGSLSVAQSQLKNGDFYVYYTKDALGEFTCPRIAIRKENGQIAEIRGVAPNQNIEHNMERVIEEKLNEPDFPDRDVYRRKVESMQMMTYVHTKWKTTGNLDINDLKFLYEIDEPILGFGYKHDPRISEIIQSRDIKSDLMLIFGCSEKEISIGNDLKFNSKVKVHYGNVRLPKALRNVTIPKIIGGNIDFSELEIAENVVFPVINQANLTLDIKTAKNVKLPGGILHLTMYNLQTFKNLEFPSTLERIGLPNIKNAKGLVFPEGVKYLSMESLKSVENLALPSGLESLYLNSVSNLDGLVLPDTLRDLCLISTDAIKNVSLPKGIKQLIFSTLGDTTDLTFPDNLESLSISNALNNKNIPLPQNLDSLHLGGLTDVKGMKFPMGLKRLDLSLETIDGLNLPKGLVALSLYRVENVNGLVLPEKLEILNLGKVKNLSGIVIPQTLIESSLGSLQSASDITFPKKMKELAMPKLTYASNLVLPENVAELDIRSLTDVDELVLPRESEYIYLSPDLDVTKIVVPEDEMERERLLGAISAGYRCQRMASQWAEAKINAVREHFSGVLKSPTTTDAVSVGLNPPKRVVAGTIPRVVKVAVSKLDSIRKNTANIISQTLEVAKSGYQNLRNKLQNFTKNSTSNVEQNDSSKKR